MVRPRIVSKTSRTMRHQQDLRVTTPTIKIRTTSRMVHHLDHQIVELVAAIEEANTTTTSKAPIVDFKVNTRKAHRTEAGVVTTIGMGQNEEGRTIKTKRLPHELRLHTPNSLQESLLLIPSSKDSRRTTKTTMACHRPMKSKQKMPSLASLSRPNRQQHQQRRIKI